RGEDPAEALSGLPLEAIAYVHVAGGFERDGVWHDSHAHPVPRPVLDILADLASRTSPPGVLLERDENFPAPSELRTELDAVREALDKGAARRSAARPAAPPTPAPAPSPAPDSLPPTPAPAPDSVPPAAGAARQRLALAQTALLSALVAGTPAPEGFDRVRVGVQAVALAAKRADVVAKVAPELPALLGARYRPAFLAYAQAHPMTGGYRQDALEFAEDLLTAGRPEDARARRELRAWWRE